MRARHPVILVALTVLGAVAARSAPEMDVWIGRMEQWSPPLPVGWERYEVPGAVFIYQSSDRYAGLWSAMLQDVSPTASGGLVNHVYDGSTPPYVYQHHRVRLTGFYKKVSGTSIGMIRVDDGASSTDFMLGDEATWTEVEFVHTIAAEATHLDVALVPAVAAPDTGTYLFDQIGYAMETDGDWLFHAEELANGTDSDDPDSDGDGMRDGPELAAAGDPLDADMDDDGIADGAEDADQDGIVDPGETDPHLADTDGDGLGDGLELGLTLGIPDGVSGGAYYVAYVGTDPAAFTPDSDPGSTTDPLDPDSDGDGLGDGQEDLNGNGAVDAYETDPNVFDLVPDGDTIATAFPVADLPYDDGGNTCGLADDYRPSLYGTAAGPDVVYAYTPPTDTVMAVSACAQDGVPDLRLYVLEDEYPAGLIASGVGLPAAGCVSAVEVRLEVRGGHTYYIIVDALIGQCGDYQIHAEHRAAVGVIRVAPQPSHVSPPWHISGENGYELDGSGVTLLEDVEAHLTYTLDWLHLPGWSPPAENPLVREMEGTYLELTGTYTEIPPVITGVVDVPADQGYQVGLTWERCGHDAQGSSVQIDGYEIYRRRASASAGDAKDGQATGRGATPADVKLAGWYYLATVPAHGEEVYEYVAPTICNCSDGGAECPSAFLVRATTADPFTFYDSAPDSGCAVDNLAPDAPEGFLVDYGAGNVLTWLESEAADFRYFKIYRGTSPDFAVDPGDPCQVTTDVTWTDMAGGLAVHYKIAAVDFAGNESPAVGPETVTEAGDAPAGFALHANVPNPFNPRTTIAFSLPGPGRVTLRIYDLSGRLVRTLLAGVQQRAGRHEAIWDGTDASGRPVPAGAYVARIDADGRTGTRRMMLVR